MKKLLAVFTLAVVVMGCNGAVLGPSVTQSGLHPAEIAQLNDTELEQEYDRLIDLLQSDIAGTETSGFYGVARLSYRSAILYENAFGLRDRSTGAVMSLDTGFDIGSISKIFTSAAILDLVNRGFISLDAPVGNWVLGLSEPHSMITPRELLTHRSGLPEYLGDDYELLDKQAAITRISQYSIPEIEDRVYEYSNTGFSLLALLVEAASGESYEQYIQSRLLEPVAIDNIGYVNAGWDSDTLAVAYSGQTRLGTPIDQPWLSDGPSWTLRGNGGLLASAASLDNWFTALFRGDLVDPLDPALLLGGEGFNDPPKFGEAGGNDVVSATVERWVSPEIQLTLLSSNSQYKAEELNDKVSDIFRAIAQLLIEAEQRQICIADCT